MAKDSEAALFARDREVRGRLETALRDYSQSEVARKLGVPQPNVYRYLHGAKVPASFCSLVAREYGVNPAWLLTGEGTPNLADATAGGRIGAGTLMELVEAMNAATRMTLGALAGKDHLKTLRALNDKLETMETLRARLSDQTAPFLGKLLDDALAALEEGDVAAARPLLLACKQASRLCASDELDMRLRHLEVIAAHLGGEREKALDLQFVVFRQSVLGRREPAKDELLDTYQFVVTLMAARRMDDAKRVCDAVLAYCRGLKDTPEFAWLSVLGGSIDLSMGHLRRGLRRVMRVWGRIDAAMRVRLEHILDAMQVLGGIQSVHALTHEYALARKRQRGAVPSSAAFVQRAVFFSQCALWFEDLVILKEAEAVLMHEGKPVTPQDAALLRGVQKLVRVLDGDRGRRRPDDSTIRRAPVQRDHGDMTSEVTSRILACQRATLARREKAAIALTREVESLFSQHEELKWFSATLRAIHYRNVLRLAPAGKAGEAMQKRARRFFRRYYRGGYEIFREWAQRS